MGNLCSQFASAVNPSDEFKTYRFANIVNNPTFKIMSNSTGGFPSEFGAGIVISAGPPPNVPSPNNYLKANYEAYQRLLKKDDEAQLHQSLKEKLEGYRSSYVKSITEAIGVYEGCQEKSWIVGIDNSRGREEIGQWLRTSFAQDSYVEFEARGNHQSTLCPGTGYSIRNFILRFGENYMGTYNRKNLGALCEYQQPPNTADYPFACTIVGNTMFATTNVKYGDPKTTC